MSAIGTKQTSVCVASMSALEVSGIRPACALPPLPVRLSDQDESVIGVQLTERGRSLRTERSVPVTRIWDIQLCP